MSENSKIEWTDHTFNPWIGCQKVGPGCDHCYAESMMAGRLKKVQWGPGAARVRTSPANWRAPLAWNAAHAEFYAHHGRRQRVFCASLADVFDNAVDPTWRRDLFALIAKTPNLDWLLLTKRIGNVGNMLPVPFDFDRLYPNVRIGATITNRDELLRDAPKLKTVGALSTFWSVEPMLGDLGDIPRELMPDWVICGGESGPGARPMHPAWARSLRDQCAAAGVPFLFKQWGEWHPCRDHDPESHGLHVDTEAVHIDGERELRPFEAFALTGALGWEGVCRVGKKAAGRLLDGVQHDGFPGGAA